MPVCLNAYRKNGSVRSSSYIPSHTKTRATRRRAKRQAEKSQHRDMRAEGEWRYSFNEKYRLNVNTAEIQTRQVKNRGNWQPIKDRDRHRMPKAICEAFNQTLGAIQTILGSSENAHTGSHSAPSSAHNAHRTFESDTEATPPQRL